MDKKLQRKLLSIQKLDMAAVYYSGRSNTLSRYFSEVCSEMRDELNVKQCPPNLMCTHCKTLFHPGNHKVRVNPQRKPSKKVLKLLNEPHVTGKIKCHLVDNAKKNKTCAVITCNLCKKKTKLEGFTKPPKKKVPVIQEPPRELTRKEKKKLMKRAKKRESDKNAGLIIPTSVSNPASNPSVVNPQPAVAPILPKAIKATEIKQDNKIKHTNITMKEKTGKSKKSHSKLQAMLNKEQTKPASGLHSFLASLNQ